jgi:hypothetical protein
LETLTLEPPLLGESRATRALRDFIIAVSLRDEPVLLTGPAGAGKALAAGKIHAIGPHTSHSCRRCDAVELDPSRLSALIAAGSPMTPGSLFVRNAERLLPEVATRLAAHSAEGALPRLILGSRRAPESAEWDAARAAGLDPAALGLHQAIAPLSDRREDIPSISRYQVWLHSFPDRFEQRWSAFEERILPGLLGLEWPGNVSELVEFVVAQCGGGDGLLPRATRRRCPRWGGLAPAPAGPRSVLGRGGERWRVTRPRRWMNRCASSSPRTSRRPET